MKLELKHLAPYLPYELMARNTDAGSEKGQEWMGVKKVIGLTEDTVIQSLNNFPYMIKFHISKIRPILLPLSDLKEEQYSFIYEDETDYESIEMLVGMDCYSFMWSKFSYEFWQTLFAYHFDIYGLINVGLAIDKRIIKYNNIN